MRATTSLTSPGVLSSSSYSMAQSIFRPLSVKFGKNPHALVKTASRKIGMNSSDTAQIFFDNVRVGKDRLLGETEDTGSDARGSEGAKAGFTAERVGIAALSLGIINEAQRLSIDYAKNRKLWGQEIAQFQLIQLKLAEMEVARINVQNMLFSALERGKAGKPLSLSEASAMNSMVPAPT